MLAQMSTSSHNDRYEQLFNARLLEAKSLGGRTANAPFTEYNKHRRLSKAKKTTAQLRKARAICARGGLERMDKGIADKDLEEENHKKHQIAEEEYEAALKYLELHDSEPGFDSEDDELFMEKSHPHAGYQLSEVELREIEDQEMQRMEELELELMTHNLSLLG